MAKLISGSNPDMNKRAKLMRVFQLKDVQERSDEASRKVRRLMNACLKREARARVNL